MIRLRADDLSYPAIFFIEHGFAIWKDSRSVFCAGAGLLVDGDLRCYRVMSAESPFFKDGRLLTRDERGRVEYPSETLVCDGDPFFTSLDDVRKKIVWMVSAQGHFESPFGLESRPGLNTQVRCPSCWKYLEAPNVQ